MRSFRLLQNSTHAPPAGRHSRYLPLLLLQWLSINDHWGAKAMLYLDCGCVITDRGRTRCPPHDAAVEEATANEGMDTHGMHCHCHRCRVVDEAEAGNMDFPPNPENGPAPFGSDY